MSRKAKSHRVGDELVTAPNGQRGYPYSDGAFRGATGALVYPSEATAITPSNAPRLQKRSIDSRIENARAAVIKAFELGEGLDWTEGYERVASALVEIVFRKTEVKLVNGKERLVKGSKDADKIKAAAELRAMAGLSQREAAGSGAGVSGGLMIKIDDAELLAKALIAYDREKMTIDGGELVDVVDVSEGGETHDDDGL